MIFLRNKKGIFSSWRREFAHNILILLQPITSNHKPLLVTWCEREFGGLERVASNYEIPFSTFKETTMLLIVNQVSFQQIEYIRQKYLR